MISIIKTTPSSITVQVDGKTVKVAGESFARGYGSPDFIIDIKSIKKWDKPFDAVTITEIERNFIIDYLLKELTARKWFITAE